MLGADLAVLGALGWAGLGVRFGGARCAGLGWAWGLALVGALDRVGRGFGSARCAGLG